jgi:hypothetical protein
MEEDDFSNPKPKQILSKNGRTIKTVIDNSIGYPQVFVVEEYKSPFRKHKAFKAYNKLREAGLSVPSVKNISPFAFSLSYSGKSLKEYIFEKAGKIIAETSSFSSEFDFDIRSMISDLPKFSEAIEKNLGWNFAQKNEPLRPKGRSILR